MRLITGIKKAYKALTAPRVKKACKLALGLFSLVAIGAAIVVAIGSAAFLIPLIGGAFTVKHL